MHERETRRFEQVGLRNVGARIRPAGDGRRIARRDLRAPSAPAPPGKSRRAGRTELNGALEQSKVEVGSNQPLAKVDQRPLTEGGEMGGQLLEHQVPFFKRFRPGVILASIAKRHDNLLVEVVAQRGPGRAAARGCM
jgi:hypothetical protein